MVEINSRMPVSDTPPETYRFIVAGLSLRTCLKKLKPAFPKKKDFVNTKIHLSGAATKLTVSLPGAAVGMPALVTQPFEAEIPFQAFFMTLTDERDDGEIVTFELAPGRFTTCGVSSCSPAVRAQSAVSQAGHEPPAPMMNPMDAAVGALLLPAYAHIRRYGLQLSTADRILAQQQLQVQRILDNLHVLLAPLGLTRLDIQRILDQRIGL